MSGSRSVSHCTKHPDSRADLYCMEHDVLVCATCFVREHNQHKSDTVAGAEEKSKLQLSHDRIRLNKASDEVNRQLEDARKAQQDLRDKKAALEADIKHRHARIVAAADRHRDEALAALGQMTDEMESLQKTEVESIENKLQELKRLLQQIQQALDSAEGSDLLAVAREMRSGRGSKNAVQTLTTEGMATVCRPVLRYTSLPEFTFVHVHDYIGTVAKMEMAVSALEVSIVEQFRCGQDPDTEVYSISPLDKGQVIVSYSKHQLQADHPSQEFSTDGQHLATYHELTGSISWQQTSCGKSMHLKREKGKMVCTYAKSHRLLRLNNYEAGEGDIRREEVVSHDPLKTEQKSEALINCGLHRAFDADSGLERFVVLEEAIKPDMHRRVRLYLRPHPDAIATYSPPVAPFQPSDVCFYTLGGQEVLLVADELNDAIHVVNVQDGRLSFLRYLAPGCPLLVQPTALSRDTSGRLWVACRGGRILTCTPISEETTPKTVLEVSNPSLNCSDSDITDEAAEKDDKGLSTD